MCKEVNNVNVFSCEEAALEGQMLSVCVCLSVCLFDCLTPKLNITKVMLFEVYKTNWLYKGTQNQFTVQVYTNLLINNVHKTSW